MKLEEAMILLSILLEVKARLGKTDEHDAIKLGIEALRRHKLMRESSGMSWDYYLPGETQE